MMNATATRSAKTRPTLDAAIQLIWQEAEKLDRKDYASWLTLWSETGHYTVPIDPDTTDFEGTLNYVYDDHAMRTLRVQRMTGGHSASASDAARTVRTVSRFVDITSAPADDDGIVEVRSAQIVVACKHGTTTLFGADLTHRIAHDPSGKLRIVDKIVRLVDSTEALNAIGFLL